MSDDKSGKERAKQRRSKSAERLAEARHQAKVQESLAAHPHPRLVLGRDEEAPAGKLSVEGGGAGLLLTRTVASSSSGGAARRSAGAGPGAGAGDKAPAASAGGAPLDAADFDVALSLTSGLFGQQEGARAMPKRDGPTGGASSGGSSSGLGLAFKAGGGSGRGADAEDSDEALDDDFDSDYDDDDQGQGDSGEHPLPEFKYMDVGRAMHRRAVRYAESLARSGAVDAGSGAAGAGAAGSASAAATVGAGAGAGDDLKGAVVAELTGKADKAADAKLGGHSRVGRDFQAAIPDMAEAPPAAAAAALRASASGGGGGAGSAGSAGSAGGGSSSGGGLERKLLIGDQPAFPSDLDRVPQRNRPAFSIRGGPAAGAGGGSAGGAAGAARGSGFAAEGPAVGLSSQPQGLEQRSSRVGQRFQAEIPDFVPPAARKG